MSVENSPSGIDSGRTLTWRELLDETIRLIGDRPAARWLCETACGLEGQDFLDELKQPAMARMVAHLDAMVQRYRNGEPLAYVLGRWSFRTIDVVIDRRVLIPRPETEVVAGRAIELARMSSGSRCVADLGTGSGAIGLSMAAELPLVNTEVWVTDLSKTLLMWRVPM
ncbi:MAG: protein methyltransferase HemK [Actinomycetota bacterium]